MYSLELTDAPQTPSGRFIEETGDLHNAADVLQSLGLNVLSGFRASMEAHAGTFPLLDSLIGRINAASIRCEDQCSDKHYFDLFRILNGLNGKLNRVVEVGVFLGGASVVLAGCLIPFNMTLDLVDVSRSFLLFTYERIRRTFPEAAGRVRLFHGDLPTYVYQVMKHEAESRTLVHHDGSHEFNQVVKDLSSLYFVRQSIEGLLIQDMHLRGSPHNSSFVDAAVYAVFGPDVPKTDLGLQYGESNPALLPNIYEGNYFLKNVHESAYIRFEDVIFRYPHASMNIEEFLPEHLKSMSKGSEK